MKIIEKIRLAFILALMVCTLSARGDDPESSTDEETPLYKEKEEKPSDRPRAPSNVRIMFSYNTAKGICYFVLPCSVSHIYIDAIEVVSGMAYQGEADSMNPTWEQELLAGQYYIRCTADDGSVFSGFVTI